MNTHTIVSQEEWDAAQKEFLIKEKEFTHLRDAHSRARQALPVVRVEKGYTFQGPEGSLTLLDLFGGQRQLIVYHLMFDPEDDAACKHCSCVVDNIAGSLVHLQGRATAFAAISRAPLPKIQAFKQRMGWTFPWVSSFGSDFNYDYRVTIDPEKGFSTYNYENFPHKGEMPGLSTFVRKGNEIFHGYSTYFRGLDIFLPMYHLLDATPLGRQEEDGRSMGAGAAGSWIEYHDRYGAKDSSPATCCHG